MAKSCIWFIRAFIRARKNTIYAIYLVQMLLFLNKILNFKKLKICCKVGHEWSGYLISDPRYEVIVSRK